MSDELVNVKADTPEEFMDAAHAAIRDGDALGVTNYDLGPTKWQTKDGKITSGELKVTTKVRRATWSGMKKSNTKDKNILKAQADINNAIKTHENKHVKVAEYIVAKAKAAFEKGIFGKTEDEAQQMLGKIAKEIDDAYETLDAKEGSLVVRKNANGSYTLKASPAR